MRKLTTALAAMALLVGVTAAYATDTGGTITRMDTAKGRVTLDNGSTYRFANDARLSSFKVGQKVQINYSYKHGHMDATAIEPARM